MKGIMKLFAALNLDCGNELELGGYYKIFHGNKHYLICWKTFEEASCELANIFGEKHCFAIIQTDRRLLQRVLDSNPAIVNTLQLEIKIR